jgi:hypothetical protein
MRPIFLLCVLYAAPGLSHEQVPPDPYGAKGPCANLFRAPGGTCLDGEFTVEIEIGSKGEVVASKVISASTSQKSSGPVDAVAQCVASNMAFYGQWYVKPPILPGKSVHTIHVVSANTCPES